MRKLFCGVFGVALALVATAAFGQDASRVAAAVGVAGVAQYGDWRPGPGWDRDIEVRCASNDFRYNFCQVDTGRGSRVVVAKGISKTYCEEGRNWGWNRAGIWVDGGCEAVFRVQRRWSGDDDNNGGWRPGPDWDRAITFRCESQGYGYNMCRVDTGRGSNVRIRRQLSKTACIEGRTWGWNRAGVWVDKGCGAEFLVDRRWK
ncbi:DUF3011 domain-containing protein [Dokdonella sp.]|uniref:DUF3011 domain-containing protein n=1 Tax=Dokdonella sp. TaxID=2291710 RepID=UPI001B25E298|nr:DUF3011 domain-containing protein [Dokdonella sp.]MBO9665036.1 DUF3011 domain-containing protein [Dokdonella sp.]